MLAIFSQIRINCLTTFFLVSSFIVYGQEEISFSYRYYESDSGIKYVLQNDSIIIFSVDIIKGTEIKKSVLYDSLDDFSSLKDSLILELESTSIKGNEVIDGFYFEVIISNNSETIVERKFDNYLPEIASIMIKAINDRLSANQIIIE